MKKFLFSGLGICCLWIPLQAQMPQQVLSAGGHSGTHSFTLGEAVVDPLPNSSPTLTQGFHQPRLTITALPSPFVDLDVQAFPNTTFDHLFLQIPPEFPSLYRLRLVAMDGKVLQSDQFTVPGRRHEFDLTPYAAGIYFLEVRADQFQQTFKIEKLSY